MAYMLHPAINNWIQRGITLIGAESLLGSLYSSHSHNGKTFESIYGRTASARCRVIRGQSINVRTSHEKIPKASASSLIQIYDLFPYDSGNRCCTVDLYILHNYTSTHVCNNVKSLLLYCCCCWLTASAGVWADVWTIRIARLFRPQQSMPDRINFFPTRLPIGYTHSSPYMTVSL